LAENYIINIAKLEIHLNRFLVVVVVPVAVRVNATLNPSVAATGATMTPPNSLQI
jgi:hypothetical protein